MIVRERINEVQRGVSALSGMNVGRRKFINDWLEKNRNEVTDAVINADNTVDCESITIISPLPEYIRLRTVNRMRIYENKRLMDVVGVLPKKIVSTISIFTNRPEKYRKNFINEARKVCEIGKYTQVQLVDTRIRPNRYENLSTNPQYDMKRSVRTDFVNYKSFDNDGGLLHVGYAPGYITYWQLKYVQSKGKEGAYYVNVYEISHLMKNPGEEFKTKYAGSYKERWKNFVDYVKNGWYSINDTGLRWLESHRYFEKQKPDLSGFVEYEQRNRPNPW